MLIFIVCLLSLGTFLLIYGLIKTRSVYKVLFLMKNEDSIRKDIKRIYDEIIKTTNLKEKNKLQRELKINLQLFQIKDKAVEGLTNKFLAPREYKVDEELLKQFNVATGIMIMGLTILLIGIFSIIIMIRISPYYYSYFTQI